MFADQPRTKERATSAAVSAVVLVLLGWLLVSGLTVSGRRQVDQALQVLQLAPEPPPPSEKIAPTRAADPRRDGAAAPPNLTSKATPLVAPPPPVPLPQPPSIVVSPVAGVGDEASAGAARVPGPGSGSGGQGAGTGSGDGGDGDGAGGGAPASYDHGRVRLSDLPREARDAYVAGTVVMDFAIGANGRVTQCRVTESGGSPVLDAATCQLAIEKLRFHPARDQWGRAIPSRRSADQTWYDQHRTEPD